MRFAFFFAAVLLIALSLLSMNEYGLEPGTVGFWKTIGSAFGGGFLGGIGAFAKWRKEK